MRLLCSTALVLALAVAAFGQQGAPEQLVAAGAGWNQYASPQINGLLVYAHRLTKNRHLTYSFSSVNLLSAKPTPFRLMTTAETGVAQHIRSVGNLAIYAIGTAGLAASGSSTGTNVGYVLSGGGAALMGAFGTGWWCGPYLRIVKSSLTDAQWAIGLMVGWGK